MIIEIVDCFHRFLDNIGIRKHQFGPSMWPMIAIGVMVRTVAFSQNVSVFVDPASSFILQNDTRILEVKYDDYGVDHNLRGYSITIEFDETVITAQTDDVVEGDFLSSLGDTRIFKLMHGSNTMTVESALLDGTSGQNGSGTLFIVTFKGVAVTDGMSPVTLTDVTLRDPMNTPIPVDVTDGSIYVDHSKPTMTPLTEPQGVVYNMAPILGLEFQDNCALEAVYYQMDSFLNTWHPIQLSITGTTYTDPAWELPDFVGLTEGMHWIFFKAVDDVGHQNGWAWCFIKDTTPENVTGVSATPGHQKITLNWLNPGSFHRVKIMRKGWNNPYPNCYPEYGGTAPIYPSSYSDAVAQGWTEVYDGNGDTFEDTPLLNRDICSYACFAYDDAAPPNYAPGTSTSKDCATCYFLGDFHNGPITIPPTEVWEPDGYVEFNDLSIFSLAYYQTISLGAGDWFNVCDIGPNDPPSGTQYWLNPPNPDGHVDFSDLMVFSNIWHTVAPKATIPLNEPIFDGSGLDISIKERYPHDASSDKIIIQLYLKNGGYYVKGMKAILRYHPHQCKVVSVQKGDFFTRQPHPVFLKYITREDHLQIEAAVLGRNVGIPTSGTIIEVLFQRMGHGGDTDIFIDEADLRDIKNIALNPSIHIERQTAQVPEVFDLYQNFPNPFNSSTIFKYHLPEKCHVELSIFNNMGQQVMELVNEEQNPGVYTAKWEGVNTFSEVQASGTYLAVLRAGTRKFVRKLLYLR